MLRQNLLGQAITELNFQSPETVNTGTASGLTSLTRGIWSLPSGTGDRGLPRWSPLDWLRDAGEPLYGVMHEISFIVRETPESVRQAERWQVPNKLTHRSRG